MSAEPAGWRAELAVWLLVAAAVTAAFWIGSGPAQGLLAGAGMLTMVAVVHFGRRRIDAVRIAGGAGDERNRDLYTRATAAAGSTLWLVMTVGWLVSVVRGEQNMTLLALQVTFAIAFFGSSLYYSRRG